jgi:hypothetical protein
MLHDHFLLYYYKGPARAELAILDDTDADVGAKSLRMESTYRGRSMSMTGTLVNTMKMGTFRGRAISTADQGMKGVVSNEMLSSLAPLSESMDDEISLNGGSTENSLAKTLSKNVIAGTLQKTLTRKNSGKDFVDTKNIDTAVNAEEEEDINAR